MKTKAFTALLSTSRIGGSDAYKMASLVSQQRVLYNSENLYFIIIWMEFISININSTKILYFKAYCHSFPLKS